MNEVSDSSNTSSAPESHVMAAPPVAPGPLRRLLQQDASNGSDAFDDRILTVSSADSERAWPINGDGGDRTIALGATPPGTALLGTAQDPSLMITDSSASHLGDMVQSDAVAAPNFGDPHASHQASGPASLADRSTAVNDVLSDVLQPSVTAHWHDAAPGMHRNGELARDTVDPGDDAGSAGMSNHPRHADHRLSPALDILPLDNIVDPAPHHNATADDGARPAHGSHDRSDPILSLPTNGHADAGHTGAAHPDAAPAHADVLRIDGAPDPADDVPHAVGANHNDAASSGTAALASDDAAVHQTSTTPPSTGALVESGTKAILIATDESPNRIGPHASAADFAISPPSSHVHSTAHMTAAFSPGVLGARDQLASAIATATPQAAAMTTLPSSQITGAPLPTLGGDVHALQKHAA